MVFFLLSGGGGVFWAFRVVSSLSFLWVSSFFLLFSLFLLLPLLPFLLARLLSLLLLFLRGPLGHLIDRVFYSSGILVSFERQVLLPFLLRVLRGFCFFSYLVESLTISVFFAIFSLGSFS